MLKPADYDLLGQTGPNTTMGSLLRRYWLPAVLGRELEADGAPVRVRLLGENLIAFRGTDGRVGLLGEHCAHRGASLYFARNEQCALRCAYHGWQYDVDGKCIDQPNEPEELQFKDKVRQKAYPCIERNGVVWAYMGPPEKKPALPDFEWLSEPEEHVYVSKRLQSCHWTQGMEGDLDPSHIAFLHGHILMDQPALRGQEATKWRMARSAPYIAVEDSEVGIVSITRRDAAPETYNWEIGHWFFPCFTVLPAFPGNNPFFAHAWVPIDDERSWVYTIAWHPTRPLTAQERVQMDAGTNIFPKLRPGTYELLNNRSNDYAGPDAPPAKQPWMRMKDVQSQDIAVTESMGPLYDRTQECLSSSDRIVLHVRQRLVDAAQALKEGREPPGMNPTAYRLRGANVQVPRRIETWREAVGNAVDARPEAPLPAA